MRIALIAGTKRLAMAELTQVAQANRTLGASHDLIEMLVDPQVQRLEWAVDPSWRRTRRRVHGPSLRSVRRDEL